MARAGCDGRCVFVACVGVATPRSDSVGDVRRAPHHTARCVVARAKLALCWRRARLLVYALKLPSNSFNHDDACFLAKLCRNYATCASRAAIARPSRRRHVSTPPTALATLAPPSTTHHRRRAPSTHPPAAATAAPHRPTPHPPPPHTIHQHTPRSRIPPLPPTPPATRRALRSLPPHSAIDHVCQVTQFISRCHRARGVVGVVGVVGSGRWAVCGLMIGVGVWL